VTTTTDEPITRALFKIAAIVWGAAIGMLLAGCDSTARVSVFAPVTVEVTILPEGGTSTPQPPTSNPGPVIDPATDTLDGPRATPETPTAPVTDTPVNLSPDCEPPGRGQGTGEPGNGKGRGAENGKGPCAE
jgi:hypothetical protein